MKKNNPRRFNGKDGMYPGVCFLLLLSLLLNPACVSQTITSQAEVKSLMPSPEPSLQVSTNTPADKGEEIHIADAFVKEDELMYEGYTVRRREKKVRVDYPPEMKASAETVGVLYAVLERKGKVLLSFDGGMHNGGLNSANFGLFPFLGGNTKQLIISQDVFRGGRQWIVNLSPSAHIIFDGAKFGVGREADDMSVVDLDRDGIYEIAVPVTDFYGFKRWTLAPMATPLPTVIFKFDAKAGKYLPANERFQDYLLKDMAEAKAKVSGPEEREKHLADVLSIVVDYIFAGKEREAWEFYEAAYKLPDRVEVKREIKATLKAQPVYNFMYRKAANH